MASETIRLSTGAVVKISEIEGILPYGEYADEVTLLMRSGARHFAGSGYNKTRQQTLDHWRAIISGSAPDNSSCTPAVGDQMEQVK